MGNCHLLQQKEMTDPLVAFAGRGDQISSSTTHKVVGPLIAAKYDIPVVMQTVGFGHTPRHIKGVTKSHQHTTTAAMGSARRKDLAWIDVTPPSMSILQK